MDVTPRELRDMDIREAFRGYHREDVDDLLERAAGTIDGLNEQVRQLSDRVQTVESDAGRSRETEEMLHRTLLLAQRTADEAIAEAQAKAHQLMSESEARAHQLVAEAEGTSRRVAESERRRLEAEVLDLAARRDALLADVDALDKFDADYRARLREAISGELDTLTSRATVQSSPRPTLHEVDLPGGGDLSLPGAAVGAGAQTIDLDSLDRPRDPVTSPPPTTLAAPPAAPAVAPPAPPSAPAPVPSAPPAAAAPPPANTDAWAPPQAAGSSPIPSAPPPSLSAPAPEAPAAPPAAPPLFDPNGPADPEVLDDDAFFASLREAVRDDSPLGTREPGHEQRDEHDFYDPDADDTGRFGNVFKRRR